MKKILGLCLISTSVLFLSSCGKKENNIGDKNGLPNDGIQVIAPKIQIATNELDGNKLTGELVQNILEKELIVTSPDSANVVRENKKKITITSVIPTTEMTATQGLLVEVDVTVDQYVTSKENETKTGSTTIQTAVEVEIVEPIKKHGVELIGTIDPVTPQVGMDISADLYLSGVEVSIDGIKVNLADGQFDLYDSLVDYSTPGDYAIQLHVGKKNDKHNRDLFIPVRVNEHKVPTKEEVEQYFDLGGHNRLACKRDVVFGKTLFIPSKYKTTENNVEVVKTFDSLMNNGCEKTATRDTSKVERLVISKGIKNVEQSAFSYTRNETSSLVRIDLPEGLQLVEGYAFSGHNNVKLLKLPTSASSTLTVYEGRAFGNMYGIKFIIVTEMPKLGNLTNSHSSGIQDGHKLYDSDNYRIFSGLGVNISNESLEIEIFMPFDYKNNGSSYSQSVKTEYSNYIDWLQRINSTSHLKYYEKLDSTVLNKYYKLTNTVITV